MKEDSLSLPNGFDEDHEEWLSAPPPPPPRTPPPPADRGAVLSHVGPAKRGVYALVRQCVDDLDRVAPWQLLYYPPQDPAELLGMVGAVVASIAAIPRRVDALLHVLPAADAAGVAGVTGVTDMGDEPTREDVGFLFHGIHRMVAHDVKRLESTLVPIRTRDAAQPPTLAERQLLCELGADLKGKYASAMMGAAASLIGQGLWNGVELEPVLFPEKAEEFRCTRELYSALKEAIAAIRQLPQQIPFPDLLARWQRGERVDQYALADLPSLRGKLGKLLQERSRRALYSGDYHQISRREVLLSTRINELERLHQQTWEPTPPIAANPAADPAPVYARLGQLTLEVAAVLDAEILKSLLGAKRVDGLRGRAAKARELAKARPDEIAGTDALASLLADDDLRIFFEMLLGAVQRRACFSVPDPAPPPQVPTLPPAPKPSVPAAKRAPAKAPVPVPPAEDPRAVLARLQARLDELQSPHNANWNAFRMTQRLLGKHARIPDAMFQSLYPFLQDVQTGLVPDLKRIAPYRGLTVEAVERLEGFCREVLSAPPAVAQMQAETPRKLERLLRFLDAVRAILPEV